MALRLDASTLVVAATVSLALVAATGIALAVPYKSDPLDAHASVAALPSLLRGAHAWAASFTVALYALAGARAFIEGPGTRARGQGTTTPLALGPGPWALILVGVAALALALAAFESGAVLTWDQRAWEAWLHVRDGARLFAFPFSTSETPADVPLALVFGAHLVAGLALVVVGAWLVRRARPARHTALATTGAVLGATFALALLATPALGPAPIGGLEASRPHWPFAWLTPLQDALGTRALLALPLAIAAMALVAWRPPRARGARVAVVAVAGAGVLVLTVLGLR